MLNALAMIFALLVSGPPQALFDDLRAAPTPEAAERVAEDILTSWLESDSATVGILLERAMIAQATGDNASAFEFFDRIILIAPEYPEAYFRRAALFMSEDNYREALLDLNEALRLEPRHFAAWFGLATMLESLGAKKEALAAYEEVLVIFPLHREAKAGIDRLSKETLGRGI